MLRIHAPAKVNLYLAVGPVRPDGYHPVDTVLHALEFGDEVTVGPSERLRFSCVPDLGLADDDNLAYKAVLAMAGHFDREPLVSVTVRKRVPAGAGLGGASSDAAAVIVGLATLWGVSERGEDLHSIARSLGADVPFFLDGGAARFTGRGDVFLRRLPALDVPVVLVRPAEPVATAEAYRAFDDMPHEAAPPVEPLERALVEGDTQRVAALLFNAMTPSSARLVPSVGHALDLVRSHPGVLGAAMAGSGSAVFGICDVSGSAEACAAHAAEAGYWSAATRTCGRACAVERD
mgnify:CR=1 FL=1